MTLSFSSSLNSFVRTKNVLSSIFWITASGYPMSVITPRSVSCDTGSANSNMTVEPPVKSMPGFRPGAMMRNTTPGSRNTADSKKNQMRFPTKSTYLLPK